MPGQSQQNSPRSAELIAEYSESARNLVLLTALSQPRLGRHLSDADVTPGAIMAQAEQAITKGGQPLVCEHAIRALVAGVQLGQFEAAKVEPLVARALYSEDARERACAWLGLNALQTTEIEPLLRAFDFQAGRAPDEIYGPMAFMTVCNAFRRVHPDGPGYVNFVFSNLRESAPEGMRKCAHNELYNLGTGAWSKLVHEGLEHKDKTVRNISRACVERLAPQVSETMTGSDLWAVLKAFNKTRDLLVTRPIKSMSSAMLIEEAPSILASKELTTDTKTEFIRRLSEIGKPAAPLAGEVIAFLARLETPPTSLQNAAFPFFERAGIPAAEVARLLLHKDERVQHYAREFVLKSKDTSAELVAELGKAIAKRPDDSLTLSAALRKLRECGPAAQGQAELIRNVALRGPISVKGEAIAAYTSLGLPPEISMPTLIEALKNEDTEASAHNAILGMGPEAALPYVQAAEGGMSWFRRMPIFSGISWNQWLHEIEFGTRFKERLSLLQENLQPKAA